MKINITCSRHPQSYTCKDGRGSQSSYPSKAAGGHDPRGSSGGYGSEGSSSYAPYHSSGSHSAAQSIARIATDKDFAATGHGSIAIDSLISHTLGQNASGKGIHAIASLQTINLAINTLNDNDILKLNNGLSGYVLNLKAFNLSYNNIGNAGVDYLIQGPDGVKYLQSGGRELSGIMQGLFTHPYSNVKTINLANNGIGDMGAEIISNALASGSLPHLKALDVSNNQITPTGQGYFVGAMNSSKVSEFIVTIKKFAGMSRKDYYAPVLKQVIQEAQNQGIDVTKIAVDKSFLGTILSNFSIVKEIVFGYVKCQWGPPTTGSELAVEIIASKIPVVDNISKVYCWSSAFCDAMVTPEGVGVALRDLDLLGADSYIKFLEVQ